MNETLDALLGRFPSALRPALREWAEEDTKYRDNQAYIAKLDPSAYVIAAAPEELPKEVDRKCCVYKSCGNDRLYLTVEDAFISVGNDLYRKEKRYGYRRENGDYYFGDSTFEEILQELNDVRNFPVTEEY